MSQIVPPAMPIMRALIMIVSSSQVSTSGRTAGQNVMSGRQTPRTARIVARAML
jgi:hypothetical protein